LALPALVDSRNGGGNGSDNCDGNSSGRLRHARMQQRFLLRLLLGRYIGCPGRDLRLVRNASGKLGLDMPNGNRLRQLAFNLSHAGGWMAIAVGRGLELGIDLEPGARSLRWRALAQRWFPPAEADAVEAADSPAREFLRRWTAREAMIKAIGEGLAVSLSALELDPFEPDRPTRVPAHWPEPRQWSLRRPEAPDGVEVCLACTGVLQQLRSFRLLMPSMLSRPESGS